MSDNDLCPHQDHLRATIDNPPNWHFRIRRCGSHLNEQRYNNVDMRHPSWGIYISDRPGMYLTYAGIQFPIRHDTITLIPPWLNFSYHFSENISSGHAYIHFDLPRLPSGLVRSHFHNIYHIKDQYSVDLMWHWGRQLAHDPSDPATIGLQAQNIASHVFTAFAMGLDPDTRSYLSNPGKDWERIQVALDHINNHLHHAIAVGDLARLLSCSNEHCIRLFNKILKQTPTQYILSQRIEKVAQELSHNTDSIEHIALRNGFPNRHYMSRVFKKHMGESPARYRDLL